MFVEKNWIISYVMKCMYQVLLCHFRWNALILQHLLCRKKYIAFMYDLGKNANDKMPLPKTSIQKILTPTPKPQTHKSVASHTLAFCPWHSDRILSCTTNTAAHIFWSVICLLVIHGIIFIGLGDVSFFQLQLLYLISRKNLRTSRYYDWQYM